MMETKAAGASHAGKCRPGTPFWQTVLGQWIITALVLVALYITLTSTSNDDEAKYVWDFSILKPYAKPLAEGLWLTVELTVACFLLSFVLGVFVAAGRQSRFVPLRLITGAYIEVMRSTPLLIQLVWIFYALPVLTGVALPGFEAAVLALTIHMGAYFGEAFRAGIQSIPKELKEAADILGLSAFDRARFVILPQAIRNVLPVLVTLTLLLLKDTSLVSVLGINDLMNVGSNIALSTFKPLEVLSTVGIVYLVVSLPLALLVRHMELRMANKVS